MHHKDNGNQSSYANNLKAVFEQISKPYLILGTDRSHLAKLYATLGYTVGAEIGVGGGTFSDLICQHNPGVKLYGIDAWEPYEGYIDFTDPAYLEKDYLKAKQTLEPYDVTLMKMYSMDAVKLFEDGSLDFVYIDANHLSPWVDNDIREWSKKVKSGGIVSGHDYIYTHRPVMEAVDEYVTARQCRPLFLVGNPNESGNPLSICSWFWVQP